MEGRVRAPRDVLAGALFIAVGVLGLWLGRDYRTGTLLSMGPGYFPRIVCGLLAILGATVLLRGLRWQGEALPPWRLPPLLLVLLAVLAFGWSLERLGLMLATPVLVGVASVAQPGRRLSETVLLVLALDALAWAVFVWMLGMTFPVWPPGIGA